MCLYRAYKNTSSHTAREWKGNRDARVETIYYAATAMYQREQTELIHITGMVDWMLETISKRNDRVRRQQTRIENSIWSLVFFISMELASWSILLVEVYLLKYIRHLLGFIKRLKA